jgi:ribonucleotide monophosphatase NagD (HAD superfamily)
MKVTILGDEDADAAAMLAGYLPHPVHAAIGTVDVSRGAVDPVTKATQRYHVLFVFDNAASFTTTLDAQCRFVGEEATGTLPEESRPLYYQGAVVALVLRAQEREGLL